jgi:hexokinase
MKKALKQFKKFCKDSLFITDDIDEVFKYSIEHSEKTLEKVDLNWYEFYIMY